jgi:hypothetical protein
MGSTLATLFYGVLLLLIPGTIVYLFLISRLTSRLRQDHNEIYARLGEPTLFLNNSPSNSMRLVAFILSGRYSSLADPKLRVLGGACRILLVTTFLGFCILHGCRRVLLDGA